MMELELNHINDKFQQCLQMQAPSFTDFMDLGIRKRYRADKQSTKDVLVIEYTAFNDDERRIIGFFPMSYKEFMNDDQFQESFPVQCLKIEINDFNTSKVTHRDVLGSILGLGLDRKLFGDIIVKNDCAYIVCHERIVPVIMNELIQIKRSSVNVICMTSNEEYVDLVPQSEQIKTTVVSLRIDVILKGILNLSRTRCNELIEQGNVKLNQIEVTKNHKNIESGDILSVAKYGKYKIGSIGSENKKNRFPIIVDRYI